MARVETGGGGGGGQVVQDREPALWPLWRELKSLFLTRSLAPSAFVSPGSWGYFGVDFVSGLRRNRTTHKTFALLEGVSDADFEALAALAALNERRQEQMFRVVAIAYASVPLTLLATSAAIARDEVAGLLREHPGLALYTMVLLSIGVVAYFASWWRSRQIVSVLGLVRIERRLAAPAALESRGEQGAPLTPRAASKRSARNR